jgi:carboxyl-terminal processing protease
MPMSKKAALLTAVLLAAALLLPAVAACDSLPTTTVESADTELALLEEALDLIRQEYVVPEDVDAEALVRGALKGMVEALEDPYSAYLDITHYGMTLKDLSGSFEGVGAYVGDDEGRIIIIAPIPGTPAEAAGIRSGDIIIGIDGESAEGLSVMDAVLLIRGPAGTTVTLQVLHDGDTEPVDIEIVRAEIDVPSVHHEMNGSVAHIVVTNFSERTPDELAQALEDISPEGATGIILDMRGNPGGLLNSVVDVAGYFIDDGLVVSVIDNQGDRRDLSVDSRTRTYELPMVALVSEYSASGAEVLAGALQDHNRAVVAGTTTYGKGSVNMLFELTDGSGLYLTVARWYTPDGRLIEGGGIEPDYVLDPEADDAVEWALDFLANRQ